MTALPRYFQEEDNILHCLLCPQSCSISEGKSGICGVRANNAGRPALPYYGKLSAVSVDPIEKKPLYHYHPGETILSIGFFGCNLRCPFCQNYSISQEFTSRGENKSPEEITDLAVRNGSFGIAYTYSEPLVHFEYVLETAKIARKKGLRNVLVSNGFINSEPAEELLPWIDAANIDLKSFSDEFYKRTLFGRLQPVLDLIKSAFEKIHLEITTLVIPGENDSAEETEKIAGFIADLNPEIPFHLSCYFPRYKFSARPTTYEDLRPLLAAAKKHLKFVYPGNVREESDTFCPDCGALLVRRRGYDVKTAGIMDGACVKCGKKGLFRQ